MSEFVECQNCGRTFFAENLVCPYCRGGERDDADDQRPGTAARPGASSMYGFLFGIFLCVVVGVAVLSIVSLAKARTTPERLYYGLEAVAALATSWGLMQRRRWGRLLAIGFILGNAALGIAALVLRGSAPSLAWGPGPAALLLFLVPFFGPQGRERYSR